MSAGVLFAIGAVVFLLGGAGLVLFGLETFQSWSQRETTAGEDEHLDVQGTVGEVLTGDERSSPVG